MKALLTILCLSLTSCNVLYSAWGAEYHRQGGYYDKLPPPAKPPKLSEQPTIH